MNTIEKMLGSKKVVYDTLVGGRLHAFAYLHFEGKWFYCSNVEIVFAGLYECKIPEVKIFEIKGGDNYFELNKGKLGVKEFDKVVYHQIAEGVNKEELLKHIALFISGEKGLEEEEE